MMASAPRISPGDTLLSLYCSVGVQLSKTYGSCDISKCYTRYHHQKLNVTMKFPSAVYCHGGLRG